MDSSSESSHGHIGEKLCTIAEESLESARDFVRQEKQNTETMICPKKSATFGNATDLKRNTGYHLYRSKSGKNSKSDYQIRMQNVPRKRSLLVE
ncbi:unnamed protein product, partial [Mesorhabditis belari]|uniref:Uncharacterized protein n=1 Tax=Mesorhabditis belari TaxID=2138241 RepID=A0AAF3FA86_9BILA